MKRRSLLLGGGAILASSFLGAASCETEDAPGGHVRVDWSLPLSRAHVFNPPLIPFPLLTGVRLVQRKFFARLSFLFDVRIPTYNYQYVDEVTFDGSGELIPLAGNTFLHIAFLETFAHNLETGLPSIIDFPNEPFIGPHFRDIVMAGDFEAVVSWGVGIIATEPLKIRAVEGTVDNGRPFVAFDIRNADAPAV